MSGLRDTLARVPDASPAEDLEAAIADSVVYLGSDAAMRSIDADTYWPKWDSPWWHMLLLHELGETRRIPERAVTKMIDGLNALPVKIFPIRPEDAPGANWSRDCACHCAAGSIYQILTAYGMDAGAALPWLGPWFHRYQMADGGLNCDDAAYLVEHECPSSMVGTVAPLESMLGARRTPEQQVFVDRAAGFLIGRQLRLGSQTVHNAEERGEEARWLAPCFPRFYLYDVLRGLAVLVQWAERGDKTLPVAAVADVVEHLAKEFPDGVIRLRRQGYASCPTGLRATSTGEWTRQPTASFPLLDAASVIGRPSAVLTRQWTAARRGLLQLGDAGRLVD